MTVKERLAAQAAEVEVYIRERFGARMRERGVPEGLLASMIVRGIIFDINGTLININTDEGNEQIYRSISHFLKYHGIVANRNEVREEYYQIMPGVYLDDSDNFDVALRRFKKQVEKSGILSELKKRQHFEKPSVMPPGATSGIRKNAASCI